MSQGFHTKLDHSQLSLKKRGDCKRMSSSSEKGIHRTTERIKILTKTDSFQLSRFLQATHEERISVSTIVFNICFISGKAGIYVSNNQGAGLGHQQHRKFLA